MEEYVKPAKIDLAIKSMQIKDPVLVDLLLGDIYTVQYENLQDSIKVSGVPLTDYPLLIIDKGLVKIVK